VTKLDRANEPARFFYLYTSAFNCYFKNRLSMAQIFAEEALALPENGRRGAENYAASLRNLLADVVRETGGPRHGKEEEGRANL
jgi:hypothetical protein